MVRFTNRDDVLSWIKSHTSRRGVVRAIEEGRVDYLGGFRFIRELNGSGWLCRVASEYGRVWVVACGTNGTLRYLKTIPWYHYVGSTTGNTLYAGDTPEVNIHLRRISYLEHKRKQRPAQDWAGHSREDYSTADNRPFDSTNPVPVFTRFRVCLKNLWKRFF